MEENQKENVEIQKQGQTKKVVKISLKIVILLVIMWVAILVLIIFFWPRVFAVNSLRKPKNDTAYTEISIDGEIYYQKLNEDKWKGNYHQDDFNTGGAIAIDNILKVVSYSEYLETIYEINSILKDDIEPYYTNPICNYILLGYGSSSSWCNMELIDCFTEDNKIIIYGDENVEGVMASGSGYFIAIPTNMPVGTEIEYRECYTKTEIKNLREYGKTYNPNELMAYKPIIYLYPTENTEISVELLKPENITCSYPKYENEWNVLAKPNGDLTDIETNKQLYALYYESKNSVKFKIEDDGFVVQGEDTITFLEEKLAVLGLTDREAEEFIVYWLPKLEANTYNYIRFATSEEINNNMPLEINPNPDTLIRVLMTYKGIEEPIEVQEQQLETPERTGLVAVEWGGTEID